MTLLRGHRHIEIESQDDAAETSGANEQDEVFSTPRTRGARVLILPIVAYRRWISPALPARCRFYPSCSAYALEAISTHGVFKGLGLAVWRLLRCQPFHPGGYDPVPPRKN